MIGGWITLIHPPYFLFLLDNEKKELSGLAFNTNDLFDAVDTIVKSRIQKLEYDQTVEAKVVSNKQRAEGIYKVEYQSAIFDAYADSSVAYYENERVYVMIPKGDFTKQKYIVGRITESKDDDNQTKTFNFKLPFDNFVGLEDLTHNNTMSEFGFLANKPEDGFKGNLDTEAIIAEGSQATQTGINNAEATLADIKQWTANIDRNLNVINELLNDRVVNHAGSKLNAYTYEYQSGQTATFYEAIRDALIAAFDNYSTVIDLTYLDEYASSFYRRCGASFELYQDDFERLWTAARGAHDRVKAILSVLSKSTDAQLRKGINDAYEQVFYNKNLNHNYLWTWTRTDDKPVIETKLGIGVDFQTLLGNYRPIQGDYGLRILITGRTKPTEETNSEQVTEEVYLKVSDMYGNAYAFYEPQTQQKIFDISAFLTLDRIDIFFWQDHNFVDYANRYIAYQTGDGADLPANIKISDLVVKLGLTTDECQTDRVFLYTYDDMYYGYDPLDTSIAVEQLNEQRELQFAWVHIGPNGPVLVNHRDYYPEGNTKDEASLQYWKDNGGAQIQWYHFEYNCEQDTTSLPERQGGLNWKYLGVQGLDSFTLTVVPNIEKAKDKWKAIVSVSNVPFATEPLVFTNRDINVETEAFDSLNEVVFKILHESFSEVTPDGTIVEDNTLRNFYVYDINNRALTDELNRKYSAIDYYLQVWIRNNDTGEYLPMTYDPDDGLVNIEFHWPTTNSMILDWSEITGDDLERSELAPLLAGASSQYNDRIRAITRKFHIKDEWRAYLNNNTVAATVVRRGKTYHPSIDFNFGNSSSMGTDKVLTMEMIQPAGTMIVRDMPFSIEAIVHDKYGNVDSNSRYIFSWKLLSPTIITQGVGDQNIPSNSWESTWLTDNTHGFLGNVLTGVIHNNEPPIFKVTVTNATDYPISQVNGFKLCSNATIADQYIVNTCTERVEFKADGTVPISYYGDFTVRQLNGTEFVDYYPEWQMEQRRLRNSEWGNALTPPDFFRLKQRAHVTASATLSTQANTRIWVFTNNNVPDFTQPISSTPLADASSFTYTELKQFLDRQYAEAIADNPTQTVLEQLQQTYDNNLNKLAIAAGKRGPEHYVYSFDPYYQTNGTNAWQWEPKLEQYYTKIYFVIGGDNFVAQAIPFTRNLYSSTLLNSWNNKLTIDETNNAILSQMLSAGTRNDLDGKFTGVIMGNWAGTSDESLDIPGLYGLSNGEQVFGFKTDSTGFIGRSGRGRIMFDGNQSLISNVDKTSYINLDPIRYHFGDNGEIVFDDYQGYSQYFLYSQVKKTSTASLAGEDNLEQSTYWAKPFLDDTINDYFIVDPNNGVLTSGGIIARYGKLGNWMISDSGIYQRYTASAGSSIENRYMYLGYPGINDAQIAEATSEFESLYAQIEQRREVELMNIEATTLIENIDELSKYYKQIFTLDPMHNFNFFWPYYPYLQTLNQVIEESETGTLTTDEQRRARFETILNANLANEQRSMSHWHYQFNSAGEITRKSLAHVGVTTQFGNYGTGITVYYKKKNSSYSRIASSSFSQQTTDEAYIAADNWTKHPNYYYEASYNNNITSNTIPKIGGSIFYEYYSDMVWNNFRADRGLPANIETLHLSVLSTFSLEHLRELYAYVLTVYQFGLMGFNRQLNEMLAAGLADPNLSEEDKATYYHYIEMHQDDNKDEIDRINAFYDNLRKPVDALRNQAIKELYAQDKNRYAIYCGYDDPTITAAKPPLFTVTWKGYMTARAGRIGYNSPWYVSDQGLTQTNNFGTIFLGNPEARSDKTGWADEITDLANLTLLPNDKQIFQDADGHNLEDLRGPLVLGASEETASYGGFAIYAGSRGKVWRYVPNSDVTQPGTYNFTYEDKPTIKFGVRMDGTLYATQGKIGGWQMTHNMLYSGDVTNPADLLVLDAERGVISLGGAIVLQKDGTVTLGKMGSDGTSAGTINIAGVIFKGRSSDEVNWSIPTYSISSSGETLFNEATYNFWGSSKTLSTATITAGSANIGTAAHDLVFTSLLDIVNSAARPIGVTIAVGEEKNDGSKKAVAIYPTTLKTENSVLGTKDHPWDIVADYITAANLDITEGNLSAKNLFMGEDDAWHLVATQFWVRAQLQDVYAKIESAASGGSSAGKTARSAATGLSNALNTLGELVELLSGYKFYYSTATYDSGKFTMPYLDFAMAWKTITAENAGEDSVPEGGGTGSATPGVDEDVLNLSGRTIPASANGSLYGSLWEYMNGSFLTGVGLRLDKGSLILSSSKKAAGSAANPGGTGGAGDPTDAEGISLNHNHALTFTEPSGSTGSVSFEIGDANFPKVTTNNKAAFNVTDTTWFKSLKVDFTAGNLATTTARLTYDSDNVYSSTAINVKLVENVSSKNVQLQRSSDSSVVAQVSIESTYAAGWNDACAKIKWGTAGDNPRTITYPTTTTPGTSTNTKTVTASVSGGGGGGGYSSIKIQSSKPSGYSDSKHTITADDVGKNIYCSHVSGGSSGSASLSIT